MLHFSITRKLTLFSLTLILSLLPYFFTLSWAHSEDSVELDSASREALDKTQRLLQDANLRKAATATDPKAQQWDQKVQQLGGSEQNTQDMYKLASDIFGDMAHQTGGDASKMIELMEKAQRDPAGFAQSLTPEQRKHLEDIAKQIPAGKIPQGQAPQPATGAALPAQLP